MATIRLQDITKSFSSRALKPDNKQQTPPQPTPALALDHLNLTIPNGQTMAIVGPSGCGKSTLLRVIAGLDGEYTGHVFYDGKDVKDVPPKERYIGMVFQNYALYPHFQGHGNLSFFFKVRKAPNQEAEERIKITSEIMGIGFNKLLGRKPGNLSGGEQQRIALARAIVRNPRLFLLDEPLSNLDAKLRMQTRIEIKRLLRQFAITSVYVTHDQIEAITLGDQIAVMRAGRMEQIAPFSELRRQPSNTFVAGFLGSPPMNLFSGGTITNQTLQLNNISVPLPDQIKPLVHTGQLVTLGIRPENAWVVTDANLPIKGFRLTGTVEVIEPDFSTQTQLVYLRNENFTFAATGKLNAPLSLGQDIMVDCPTEYLYFFDTTTEQRLG